MTNIKELVPCYTDHPKVPFTPKEAVHVIVRDRLNSKNADGEGHRARRREAELKARTDSERQLKEIFDDLGSFGIGLTTEDVDAMAELYSESRMFKPTHPNIHDS